MVDHGRAIRRHELTDPERELLAPLIPRAATGRPRVSDRQVVNGMVCKIRIGISWRDLPERYGPWKTVYTRFRRYALDGVFIPGSAADPGPCGRGRRHRLAGPGGLHRRPRPPARHRHRPKNGIHRPYEPDDHALVRSRGGLTTKLHLACDGRGRL
jgi:transposase